jgi:glyoxylase-like metal-dependent hydrolase (beta-lactamase superfamily II)
MRNLKRSYFLLCLFLFAARGLCQTESPLSVDVIRLSDRVAVFKIEGGNSNIVALNSAKGIVVIDTDISPAFAALLRQKMTDVFGGKKFAYVINTHSHGDHTLGNQVFADAVIIGHANCLDEMVKNAEMVKGLVARFKAGLVQMKESLGKMVKDSAPAKSMARKITYYETLLQGLENHFVLTCPSMTFTDRLTLHLGDLVLELNYFGTSHSTSDIIIHCPQEGLWVTGDLFYPQDDLYIDSERVLELPRWTTCLEKIIATEKETKYIIPGHEEFLALDDLKKKLAYVRAKQAEFAGKESAFLAFRKAFEEKGLEDSLRLLADLKARPEQYYTLHPEIDQFAYRLMLKGKLDEALSIFKVLAELFPDSYLAFDSLGEVYLRKGDNEMAIQSFKKSLELNPDNENAARQLKSLQEKK